MAEDDEPPDAPPAEPRRPSTASAGAAEESVAPASGEGADAGAADAALPEGWEEVLDGDRVYYYDSRTGQSSWDRPGPAASSQATAAEANAASSGRACERV